MLGDVSLGPDGELVPGEPGVLSVPSGLADEGEEGPVPPPPTSLEPHAARTSTAAGMPMVRITRVMEVIMPTWTCGRAVGLP
jgi:hypothetical protein